MRGAQLALVELFIHCEWLANKVEEQRSDITTDYHDGKLEERRGIREQ